MPGWIHPLTGLLLLAAHAVFLFRALAMRRSGGSPRRTDRIARSMSHWGLPAAVVTGIILAASASGRSIPAIHVIPALAPLAAIVIFTPFLSLRRRIPWLLPTINLVLFIIAAAVGILVNSGLH